MVKLRLARFGAKKRPFYRVVAADSRAPRDGRFIEILGYYDPLHNPAVIHLKSDRVTHWENVGAQPTSTVANLIRQYRKRVAGEAQA